MSKQKYAEVLICIESDNLLAIATCEWRRGGTCPDIELQGRLPVEINEGPIC